MLKDEIMISFTIEEVEDLLENLEQCFSEGYLNAGDPALTAMEKLIMGEKECGNTNTFVEEPKIETKDKQIELK